MRTVIKFIIAGLLVLLVVSIIIIFTFRKEILNRLINIPIKSENTKSDTNLINKKINYRFDKNENSEILFIFSHGNFGNININCGSYEMQEFMHSEGSVLYYDYPGYGSSLGYPNEKSIAKSIIDVWDFARNELNYEPENIILWGQSLGGFPTLSLLSYLDGYEKPRYTILHSIFRNIDDVAGNIFSLLKIFCKNDYSNIDLLKTISDKDNIILLHSRDDGLINFEQSLKTSKEFGIKLIETSGSHCNDDLGNFINYYKNLQK
jgi:hypothetical protein